MLLGSLMYRETFASRIQTVVSSWTSCGTILSIHSYSYLFIYNYKQVKFVKKIVHKSNENPSLKSQLAKSYHPEDLTFKSNNDPWEDISQDVKSH